MGTELHRLNIEVAELCERVAWLDANARGCNAQVRAQAETIAQLAEAFTILDARLDLIISALDAALPASA